MVSPCPALLPTNTPPSSLNPYISCTLKSNFIVNSSQILALLIVQSSFKFQKLQQWTGGHSTP